MTKQQASNRKQNPMPEVPMTESRAFSFGALDLIDA
jgi:hypothetical protein